MDKSLLKLVLLDCFWLEVKILRKSIDFFRWVVEKMCCFDEEKEKNKESNLFDKNKQTTPTCKILMHEGYIFESSSCKSFAIKPIVLKTAFQSLYQKITFFCNLLKVLPLRI